jgi:hypothetical protein
MLCPLFWLVLVVYLCYVGAIKIAQWPQWSPYYQMWYQYVHWKLPRPELLLQLGAIIFNCLSIRILDYQLHVKGNYCILKPIRCTNLYSLLVIWCTTRVTFKTCMLWPHYICMFCIYLRTNSDLCHLNDELLGFVTEMKSVYCAVWPLPLNKAVCHSSLKG